MIEKIRDILNKDAKKAGILLGIIVFVGILLRTWEYHDWLFFKWDQARDATLVSLAIENGPGELPLLGPRATKVGEDYLRLGPAFYYAQYLSGFIFQSTKPEVFAYMDTFLAILTIPLFYFFLRIYFSRFNSLLATAIYSIAFLIVQYSRFAWNPNGVPFWMLLSFYAGIKFLNTINYKKKAIYLILFSLAFFIASQYHFFAMFSLIAIVSVYLFFHLQGWKIGELFRNFKKSFSIKTFSLVTIFLAVFCVVYAPVIVSDLKTNGSNSKNFIGAFFEKPRDDKTFGEKLLRNFREQGKNYNLIATSFWTREGKKSDPYPVAFGLFLMVSGIIFPLLARKKETNAEKKSFLLLLPIWIILFFLITIPTSYQLRPRYFTAVFPVPFIVLTFWMSFLEKKFGKKGLMMSVGIFTIFFLMNAYGTMAWFKDNAIAQKRDFPTDRNFILKKDDGITLGQLEKVVDYMLKNKKEEKIVFYSKAEYSLPIEYLLLQKNKSLEIYFVDESEKLLGHKNLFAINTVKGGYDSVSDEIKDYTKKPTDSKQFGEMIVFQIEINEDKIKNFVKKNTQIKEEEEEEISIEGNEETKEKTERLFWKDVLR